MTLTIPHEAVEESGMSERDLLIELACRLYDAGKLSKWQASRMVGMTRDEFNAEPADRGLSIIHYICGRSGPRSSDASPSGGDGILGEAGFRMTDELQEQVRRLANE